MERFPMKALQEIEGVGTDPGLVSATMMKLIFSSREFEVKIYDSDSRTGLYVIVLEGNVDVGRWERLAGVPKSTVASEPIAGAASDNGAESLDSPQEEPSRDELSEDRVNRPH